MKTIGLLGGMSWESTQTYYRALNEGVRQHLGGLHSAKIAMISVDFAEIEALQHAGNWDETAVILSDAAEALERAGADFILICTNTMHKVAPQIQARVSLPLLHIADATAMALKTAGVSRVGLLGTQFTMEQDFYKGRLQDHGLEVLVPNQQGRKRVHDIIYQELCLGQIKNESRQVYLSVIDELVEEGAQAVILGCTEIGLLVEPKHTDVPLYDTTAIHARMAVEAAVVPDALNILSSRQNTRVDE
jgi:aspartate racemase